MKIDPELIEPVQIENLTVSFLSAVKKFYDDPKNMNDFELWKSRRDKEAKNC